MSATTPAPGTPLCELASIEDGAAREFVFGVAPDALRIFVVRRGANAWGYVNECPHQYIPLNDQPDAFVTWDREWIICSAHAAVFRYEDGHCEDGPCRGRRLRAFPVEVVDGLITIAAATAGT